jgi:hypothetical protein
MIQNASQTDHTIAVYSTHEQAEAALKLLQNSDFDMRNLSIIGQNYETEEHPLGFVNSGDRMWTWGKFGAFWGTIWGLLFGSAMMFVPGLGYLVFGGWIVSALEGAVIGGGLAALGGALASIGIPTDSVVKYESELKAGSFMLLAHGDSLQIQRAKELLETTSPSHVESYTSKQPVSVI